MIQLWVNLNNNFYDSTISLDDLISFLKEKKQKYLCFTCNNNFNNPIKVFKKAKEQNLIPVFSFYMLFEKSEFLLIAKNNEGYKNLVHIFNTKVIDVDCLKGVIVILIDGLPQFEDHLDFYYSHTYENPPTQKIVYLRQNNFLNKEDFPFWCILQSIKTKESLENIKIFFNNFQNNYLDQEIKSNKLFEKNIDEILSSIEEYNYLIPHNTLLKKGTDIKDSDEKLKKESIHYFLLSKHKNNPIYIERLKKEIKIICNLKYSEYFLIVFDFVSFLKKENVTIGIGRGSVCGSLISYLLQITGIDPILYDLYFERFLNEYRMETPDIDIDIETNKKSLLKNYLINKYSINSVIIPVIEHTYTEKLAIKDLLNVLKISEYKIPHIENKKILDKEIIEFHNYAKKLIGFPYKLTPHPSGIIISALNLQKYLPLFKDPNNELFVTCFDSEQIKDIGLIKFDILSSHALEIINLCIDKTSIDINDIDWNDKEVYKSLNPNNICGIFQLDNKHSLKILRQYNPLNIEDLSNCISLSRPGAFKQAKIFFNCKNNFIKNPMPLIMQKLLPNSFGIPIYQEDIMNIVSKINNFNFSEADKYRSAIAKKNSQLLLELKKSFFIEGLKNNYRMDDLKIIWECIFEFGSFAFNKSHAIAYSKIIYQMAWLKQKNKLKFYVNLFNVRGMSEEYKKEFFSNNYSFEYPNIHCFIDNNIDLKNNFFLQNNKVFLGINNLKNEKCKEAWEKAIKISKSKELISNIDELISANLSYNDLSLLNESGFFSSFFNASDNKYSSEFIKENLLLIFNSYIMGLKTKDIVDKFKNPTNLNLEFWKTKIKDSFIEI